MTKTNRIAIIAAVAVVIIASLGAARQPDLLTRDGRARRPVFTTTRSDDASYAFLQSGGEGYATICTGDRGDSSTWILLSAAGNGIETPHVAVIADADGGQRIQFKERGGRVRTISLSRLADMLDSQATR